MLVVVVEEVVLVERLDIRVGVRRMVSSLMCSTAIRFVLVVVANHEFVLHGVLLVVLQQ